MTDSTPTDRFAEALLDYEQSGDLDAIGACFAPGAELYRPEVELRSGGTDDVQRFWSDYRGQFTEIRTTFDRVVQEGSSGVLEWTSSGTLADDRPIRYRGVSLLSLDADGLVARFATYFDTAAFLQPPR